MHFLFRQSADSARCMNSFCIRSNAGAKKPASSFQFLFCSICLCASILRSISAPTGSSLTFFFVITAVISVLKGFLHLRKLFNLIFGQYHMPQYSSSLKNRNRVQFRRVSVLSASGFYLPTNERDFQKESNQHIPSRIRKRLFYMPYAYP